jgi:3-methyladenine DNA glycosylase AlkD
MTARYSATLLKMLRAAADPGTKQWWEGYVKGGAPFLGVKMADVRTAVHRWHRESVAGHLAIEQQVDLALAVFEGDHTEEKLVGTLYLQEILLPADAIRCARDLDRFAALFTRGHIHDWNVGDWFCVKVLGPLIEREGTPCATAIAQWCGSPNLWQARASLVAFVPVAGRAEYHPLVEHGCRIIIRRPERFAKTAVGWKLREVSRTDPTFVRRVVTENLAHFCAESLNRAIQTFSEAEKRAYRRMRREA